MISNVAGSADTPLSFVGPTMFAKPLYVGFDGSKGCRSREDHLVNVKWCEQEPMAIQPEVNPFWRIAS